MRAKAVLEGLLGVKHAEVSLQQGQAVVHYDPQEVTIKAMLELLTDTGYRASAP